MKKVFIAFSLVLFLAACGNNSSSDDQNATETTAVNDNKDDSQNPEWDPNRGQGKFHDVEVGPGIDDAMATKGEEISEMKCQSCHKLTSEMLVGPGWKGITERHSPDWIMNFMTNTDEMLDNDPKAQEMLEICMVRMPDQNLSDQDARDILEFMRKNDGAK